MPQRNAFTLVELLVVMAIIAVLVSIMLPALSLAREQAQFLVCKNNLRSYGQALAMYLEENDGYFPDPGFWLYDERINEATGLPVDPYYRLYPERFYSGSEGESGPWRYPDHQPTGCLWPYLGKLGDVNLCPTFLKRVHQEGLTFRSFKEPSYSYAMNAYLGVNWNIVTANLGWKCVGGVYKETQVERAPATIFTFADEWVGWGVWGWALNDNRLLPAFLGQPGEPLVDAIAGYHLAPPYDENGGVGAVVFLDGHVGSARPEESFILAWPQREYWKGGWRPK